jgi:hypothetical protein
VRCHPFSSSPVTETLCLECGKWRFHEEHYDGDRPAAARAFFAEKAEQEKQRDAIQALDVNDLVQVKMKENYIVGRVSGLDLKRRVVDVCFWVLQLERTFSMPDISVYFQVTPPKFTTPNDADDWMDLFTVACERAAASQVVWHAAEERRLLSVQNALNTLNPLVSGDSFTITTTFQQ